MAVKSKTVKKQPAAKPPANLKQDKVEEVEVKELLKDERTHKILGSIFVLLAILFFVAFTSYLFTWEEDQDKVFKEGYKLLLNSDVQVANMMGTFGAFIADFFISKGFGIASYLICTSFFVIGINLFFGKKVFSITRNLKYLILGLPLLSVTASVIAGGQAFPYGGAVGDMSANYLKNTIGEFGTYCVIGVAFLAYAIWRFNFAFRMPERKVKQAMQEASTPTPDIEEELAEETAYLDSTHEGNEGQQTLRDKLKAFNAERDAEDAAGDFRPVENGSGNAMKGEVGAIHVPTQDPQFEYEISLVEKEIEKRIDEAVNRASQQSQEEVPELIVPASHAAFVPPAAPVAQAPAEETPVFEMEVKTPSRPKQEAENLTLEIKNAEPKQQEEEMAYAVPAEKSARSVLDSKPYDPMLELAGYKYPSINLLETHGSEKIVQDPAELEENKNQIINTLKNYDITIQRISATVGPTVTLYEIVPAAGVRISRIKNLEDDIALSLAALGIRIIAPIPGKGTIGIEVPNTRKTIVSMKTLLSSDKFSQNKFSLPIAIGKRIDNENFIVDLASMPHLLMAGATGQGKSVGLNAILVSLLYSKHPSQLKFVLVDPKKVELSIYKTIENHFLAKLPGEEDAIITDTKKVVHTLNALCIEMDNRYDLLKEAGCRNIKEYNEKFVARRLNPEKGHQFLPFIVLVVDEFADLIMTAGKEVEMPIARLAQLARAIGIHLIIATQRPSVNIITGTIKANFPARIAFKVSSKIDSRTILDAGGAEQLIGKGDMLISYNGEIVRLQCAFVDTPEVDRIAEFIGDQKGYPEAFLLPEYVDEKEMDKSGFDVNDKDALFEDAAKLIVSAQSGSTSLLQRKMKLGYNRAGRLMDQLEAAGIVGASQGSKPRDVLIKTDMELQEYLNEIG